MYPCILVPFSRKPNKSKWWPPARYFSRSCIKSYAHTFSVDLWSLRPLRMPAPLPRRSSMPLCALCKLEFNCRVSSMGMEVSASYWTRTLFNFTLISLRHLHVASRELACVSTRQRRVKFTEHYHIFINPRLWPLNAGFMPNKVIANFTSPNLSLVATLLSSLLPDQGTFGLRWSWRYGSWVPPCLSPGPLWHSVDAGNFVGRSEGVGRHT